MSTLHPRFPVVEGEVWMSPTWGLTLPQPFNRRVEDGSLVYWRPGFTLWIDAFSDDSGAPAPVRLAWIREDSSPARFDVEDEAADGLLRHAYRLAEGDSDGRQPAFHAFVVGASGHLHVAMYFDDPASLTAAKAIWRSIRARGGGRPAPRTAGSPP